MRVPALLSRPTPAPILTLGIAAGVVVSVLAISGCDSSGPTALTVEIVNGSGGNPVADVSAGSIDVTVLQNGVEPAVGTDLIRSGTFDLPVPIPSYGIPTSLEVVIQNDDDDSHLVGATPLFMPYGHSVVRLVVGPPDECVSVSSPDLSPAVASPGVVVFGAWLLFFGGVDADGDPQSSVRAVEPVALTLATGTSAFASLPRSIGVTSATMLASTAATVTNLLVLGDGSADAMIFDAAPANVLTGPRDRPLTVHEGAGADSTVLALGDNGAVIVGGTRSSQLTWVDSTGTPLTGVLAVERRRPAVARVAGGILIAGGAEAGQPMFEWHALRSTLPPDADNMFGETLPARDGATLVASPGGEAAMLIYGRTPMDGSPDEGMLVPGSVVVTGRSGAWSFAAGPDAGELRAGAVAVARRSLIDNDPATLIVGGDTDDAGTLVPSAAIDIVTWSSLVPTLTAHGGLRVPRADHAAILFARGVVLVAGGSDEAGLPLDDIELCF